MLRTSTLSFECLIHSKQVAGRLQATQATFCDNKWPNACFTSAASKPRSPLSKKALSFMVWLRLVQVLLHELRMALAMGILSRFLVVFFSPSRWLGC